MCQACCQVEVSCHVVLKSDTFLCRQFKKKICLEDGVRSWWSLTNWCYTAGVKKKSGQVSVNHLTEYQREVWARRLFFSPGHKQTVTRWRSHVWTLLWCNCRRRTLDRRQTCGQMTHLMGVRDGRCFVDSSSVLDSLWVWTQNITYTNQWVCLFHSIFSYCFEMFSVCSSLFHWP